MYIPNNKIKTNLYTPGGEFVVKNTGQEYKGYYYSLYTGEFFTGKNQNDLPTLLLIPTPPQSIGDNSTNGSINKVALFLGDPDPNINRDQYNQTDIVTYLKLNGQSTTDEQPKKIPTSYYPNPTEDDYKLGVFTRYFVVKTNEIQYIELSKEVHDKIQNQDERYMWEPYTPFKLQWTIRGDEKYVANTNRDIILLTEKRLKRQGLDIFLRKNYIKFGDF
jgi:hypothetical protein